MFRSIAVKKRLEAIVKYTQETDMILLILCVISSVYGIVLISSATRNTGSNDLYIQIVALIIGIGLFVLFSLLDVDTIADRSKVLYVISLLFIATLFIWGVEDNTGNKAWLRFGTIGIQPAEVVKIPFTIILAKMIADFKDRRTLNTTASLMKIIGVFGGLFLLIILSSKDLGSALVYLFILIVMLFVGGLDLRWLLAGAGTLLAVGPLMWFRFLSQRQKDRILAPYLSTIDPNGLDIKWQPNQSKLAIASGNFLGQGLYQGTMTQAHAVPLQYTDFIFSVAGEELGFVGCFMIILLLLTIITRCIYIGIRSNSTVGMLVCTGIASMLIFQMFENIGMCLGLTPVVGLTLPFFSYGGSSLITLFAAMGIVAGIKMRPKPGHFRSQER